MGSERPERREGRVDGTQWRQRFTAVSPQWLRLARLARVRVSMAVAVCRTLLDRALHAQERGSIDGYDAQSIGLYLGLKADKVDAIAAAMRAMSMVVRSRE